MTRLAVILAATPLLSSALVAAQAYAKNPLVNQRFTYPNLPYKVEKPGDENDRGPQIGYNICNSTTAGQNSLCQTAWVNSIDDFCLWAPPTPGREVGDIEGEMVAWCTKATHGTRVIPAGALTAVQFIKTPSYLEVTGFIQQSMINMIATDDGGEMDPHGADARGNPMGGLVFTNNFATSTGNIKQVIEWHNFMGSNQFCIKVCDSADPNAATLCQHEYDRVGCKVNVPAAYRPDVFESCLGENQDPVGIYTGGNGQISTWYQPPENGGGNVQTPAFKIPASSSCTQYQSAQLYADANSIMPTVGGTNTTSNATSSSTSSSSASQSTSVVVVTATPSQPSASSSTPRPSGSTGGADKLSHASGAVALGAVILGLALLA